MLVYLNIICDVVRQSVSEVTQISFFCFLYICIWQFLIPHLAENPMKIGWLVPEIQTVEGLQNGGKQRKFSF